MNRINIILVFVFCAAFSAVAQNDRDYIRRGNRFMRDSIFDKAQIEYQKAIEADNTNAMAFEDRDQLVQMLCNKVKPGDVLLFKGSNGMRMDLALEKFLG